MLVLELAAGAEGNAVAAPFPARCSGCERGGNTTHKSVVPDKVRPKRTKTEVGTMRNWG